MAYTPALTPSFTPAPGSYSSAQTVSILDSTPGATIFYTTAGSTPTSSSTNYTGPITVSSSKTVKAIAVAWYYSQSATGTATYTLTTSGSLTPTAKPIIQLVVSSSTMQAAIISDSTVGAVIYYTTNGTTPTTNSKIYTGKFATSNGEMLKAIALASGYSQSAVAIARTMLGALTPSFELSNSQAGQALVAGLSNSTILTVTPENGFSSPVSFICSDLPAGENCTFSPSAITPNGSPATSALSISASTHAENNSSPNMQLASEMGGAVILAMIFWPFGKRKSRVMFAMVAILVVVASVNGCGNGIGVTPTTNSTVNIVATGGGVTQTTAISVTGAL